MSKMKLGRGLEAIMSPLTSNQNNDAIEKIESINIEDLKTIINKKEKEDLLIICGSLYAIGNILGKINLCS